MKKLIVLFSVMFLFNSCSFYILSKSDLSWQPYKEGDVLIFESNKGEVDTINIKEVEKHTIPNDPFDLFPTMVQTLFVVAEHSVLEMNIGETGTSIEFTLRLGDNDLRYPCSGLYINDFENKKIEGGKYKIEAKENCYNMKDKPFDLRYIYWSKEYGYLGLEFKDNYVWFLKSFVRNGKEIFKI